MQMLIKIDNVACFISEQMKVYFFVFCCDFFAAGSLQVPSVSFPPFYLSLS